MRRVLGRGRGQEEVRDCGLRDWLRPIVPFSLIALMALVELGYAHEYWWGTMSWLSLRRSSHSWLPGAVRHTVVLTPEAS